MKREIPIIADAYVDREFGTGAGEGDAGPRPQGLRVRPAPRPAPDQGHRGRRPHELRNARAPTPGMDRFACRKQLVKRPRARGAARQGRGPPARRGAVLSLPDGGGALALPAVVREDAAPGRAGHPGGGDGADPDHPRAMGEDLLRVDAEHPRLVHLAADLVGAPDSGLVLRPLRRDDRLAHDAAGLPALRRRRCGRRPTSWTPGSARASGRSPPWAGPSRPRRSAVYYPTACLVTGFDILFFWVARMIMMGLRFMGDVPFRDVVIHGLIRDEQGEKMSKTRGNVIDPLHVINGATLEELLAGAKAGGAPPAALESIARQYPDGFPRVRGRRAAVHPGRPGGPGERREAVGEADRGLPALLQQDLERLPLPGAAPARGRGTARRAWRSCRSTWRTAGFSAG